MIWFVLVLACVVIILLAVAFERAARQRDDLVAKLRVAAQELADVDRRANNAAEQLDALRQEIVRWARKVTT